MVLVKLYMYFKEIVGKELLEFPDGVTPKDILRELSKKYPSIGRAIERDDFIVLVNGSPIPDKDLERIRLLDNDIMELLPTASGGIQ